MMLRNLLPPALVAGAALLVAAKRLGVVGGRRHHPDVPLGRVTFATNLVRSRRRAR